MGCYDVFCPICGICVFIPKDDLDKKYTSKIKWIEKASFMTATNEIKKICSEISCSNVFDCAMKKAYISELYPHRIYDESDEAITGYFIHRDCYEFIKKRFKINIVFGDFYHSAKNKLTLNDHYVNFGETFVFFSSVGYFCFHGKEGLPVRMKSPRKKRV